MRGVLIRLKDDGKQTLGRLILFKELNPEYGCVTLEPSDLDNQRNISCVPPGTYVCKARVSDKYGPHFILEDVAGRSYILIHVGNFRKNTQGCILVGRDFADINNDGQIDIVSSRKAMNQILGMMPEKWNLDIVGP